MSFLDKMKQIASETKTKQQTAEDERRERRLILINAQCERIIESLESDIEKDAHGEGSWKGHVMGFIHYWLENENHPHLKLEKHWDRISPSDIEALPGFTKLKARCDALGITMDLKEVDEEDESLRRETTVVSFIIDVGGWK